MSQLDVIKANWRDLFEAADIRDAHVVARFNTFLNSLEPEEPNPLDGAVIDAAVTWKEAGKNLAKVYENAAAIRLAAAVQAKLDAEKPKTAEQIINEFCNDLEERVRQ